MHVVCSEQTGVLNKLLSDKWPLHIRIHKIRVRTFILVKLRQASALALLAQLLPVSRSVVCVRVRRYFRKAKLSCSRHWEESSACAHASCQRLVAHWRRDEFVDALMEIYAQINVDHNDLSQWHTSVCCRIIGYLLREWSGTVRTFSRNCKRPARGVRRLSICTARMRNSLLSAITWSRTSKRQQPKKKMAKERHASTVAGLSAQRNATCNNATYVRNWKNRQNDLWWSINKTWCLTLICINGLLCASTNCICSVRFVVDAFFRPRRPLFTVFFFFTFVRLLVCFHKILLLFINEQIANVIRRTKMLGALSVRHWSNKIIHMCMRN